MRPMALPTPPNSGKETLLHTFDSSKQEDSYTPLFSPVVDDSDGRQSPTAFLYRSRHSLDTRHALSPPATIHTQMKRARPQEDDDSLQADDLKRARLSRAPLGQDLPPVSPATLLPSTPRLAMREVSPPSQADVSLMLDFLKEFQRRYRPDPPRRRQVTVTAQPTKRQKPTAAARRAKKPVARADSAIILEEEQEYKPTVAKARGNTVANRKRSIQPQATQTKGEAKTTRNPANKALVSKDFRDWPDFSPRPSTLDNAQSIAENMPLMSGLKDLSQDPWRDQLHPVELIAAHHAGVDCGRYLCTKRSVFVGYLKHLLFKAGKRDLTAAEAGKGLKSWNKTAAQNCSSIDVNKTSALFAEFWTKTGWFDESHFQQYINNPSSANFPEFDKDGRLVK